MRIRRKSFISTSITPVTMHSKLYSLVGISRVATSRLTMSTTCVSATAHVPHAYKPNYTKNR